MLKFDDIQTYIYTNKVLFPCILATVVIILKFQFYYRDI